ncbi:MAG: hypothetical protein PHU64_01375 [Candidatus Omnitrophica bacterium]|nr:hypothetical protein [Candidatus Omnitrophota bacterium]MDD5430352.1 hypothetical protein [Candidatus Omnitrophota bacterium]
MIAIIISIIVGLSVLLSAFIAFVPGLQTMVEKDFFRKINSNAFLYSMQKGQLSSRAGTLKTGSPVTLDIDVRSADKAGSNVSLDRLHSDIMLDDNNKIKAETCRNKDTCVQQ